MQIKNKTEKTYSTSYGMWPAGATREMSDETAEYLIAEFPDIFEMANESDKPTEPEPEPEKDAA